MQKHLILPSENLAEYFLLGAIFFLPFSIALLEICLSLSFLFWTINKIVKKQAFCSDRLLFLLAGGFMIASSISAFEGGYPLLSFRGMIKIIKYVLVMFLAFDLFRSPVRLKRLFVVFLVSCALVLMDAMVQRFSGGTDLIRGLNLHYAGKQLRLTGPFKFYGLLGAYLIGVLPVLLLPVIATKKAWDWKRVVWGGFFLLGLYVLYKTHSRGVWIAAFLSFALYAWLIQNKWIAMVLIAGLIAIPFALPGNTLIHLNAERKEQSLVERYHLWYRAIQVIQKRPWFGCGINTYVHNYPKFDETKNWRVPGYYVHNGYLQLAAETGLVSLFLFFLIIGSALRAGFLAIRSAGGPQKLIVAGVLTGLVGLLLQAGVDTTLHNLQSAVMIWFLLGLLMAVTRTDSIQNIGNNGRQ